MHLLWCKSLWYNCDPNHCEPSHYDLTNYDLGYFDDLKFRSKLTKAAEMLHVWNGLVYSSKFKLRMFRPNESSEHTNSSSTGEFTTSARKFVPHSPRWFLANSLQRVFILLHRGSCNYLFDYKTFMFEVHRVNSLKCLVYRPENLWNRLSLSRIVRLRDRTKSTSVGSSGYWCN